MGMEKTSHEKQCSDVNHPPDSPHLRGGPTLQDLHLPPSPSIYRSSKIADNLSQLSSTTDEDKNSDPPKPNLT